MSSSRGRGGRGAASRFLRQLDRTDVPLRSSHPGSSSSHQESPHSSGGSLGDSMDRIDLSSTGGGGTDPRTEIILVSGNLLPVEGKPSCVSGAITLSFKTYMDPGGYAWKFVSEEFKLTYWNEFLKAFRWSPPLTEAKVYELWLARAARRYSDHVSLIKSDRYTKGRPLYMPDDIWEKWCAYWDTDAAKALSERAKKNRLSEPDGPGTGVGKHRGGSRSAVAYSYQMARDQGVSIKDTIYPTFKKLHYSERDNTYTSEKAKRIAEDVDNQVADLSQGLPDGVSPTPADTSSIFIGVAQHPVKNRVFGVGSLYSVPSICSRWEGGGDEFPSTQSDSTLRVELDVALAKFEASEKAREEMERRQAEANAEQQRLKEMYDRQQQEQQELKERYDRQQQENREVRLMYDRQQQENREVREMYEQQQLLLQRILRDRETPPDI